MCKPVTPKPDRKNSHNISTLLLISCLPRIFPLFLSALRNCCSASCHLPVSWRRHAKLLLVQMVSGWLTPNTLTVFCSSWPYNSVASLRHPFSRSVNARLPQHWSVMGCCSPLTTHLISQTFRCNCAASSKACIDPFFWRTRAKQVLNCRVAVSTSPRVSELCCSSSFNICSASWISPLASKSWTQSVMHVTKLAWCFRFCRSCSSRYTSSAAPRCPLVFSKKTKCIPALTWLMLKHLSIHHKGWKKHARILYHLPTPWISWIKSLKKFDTTKAFLQSHPCRCVFPLRFPALPLQSKESVFSRNGHRLELPRVQAPNVHSPKVPPIWLLALTTPP